MDSEPWTREEQKRALREKRRKEEAEEKGREMEGCEIGGLTRKKERSCGARLCPSSRLSFYGALIPSTSRDANSGSRTAGKEGDAKPTPSPPPIRPDKRIRSAFTHSNARAKRESLAPSLIDFQPRRKSRRSEKVVERFFEPFIPSLTYFFATRTGKRRLES